MDDDFIPSCQNIQVSKKLRVYLKEVQGAIGGRASDLANRIGSPAQSGIADVAEFMMLQLLNRNQTRFTHRARRSQLHPEDFYLDLAGLLGELMTFTEPSRLTQVPGERPTVVITTPAIGHVPPRPVLMFSCVDNITRMQVALMHPLDVHDIAVTLNADNRALRSHWFVRENGTLLESSRGLASPELENYERRLQQLLDTSPVQPLETGMQMMRVADSRWPESLQQQQASTQWNEALKTRAQSSPQLRGWLQTRQDLHAFADLVMQREKEGLTLSYIKNVIWQAERGLGQETPVESLLTQYHDARAQKQNTDALEKQINERLEGVLSRWLLLKNNVMPEAATGTTAEK